MRFTSLSFLVFFLLVYVVYWSFSGQFRIFFLPLVSLLFYAAWSPVFALHFLLVVIVNFALIMKLHDRPSRGLLAAIISLDLVNLFLFKYFYLFLQTFHNLTGFALFERSNFNTWLTGETGFSSITLPLAISFYTFQLIAYAVDTHRSVIREKVPFREFALFIVFFPHFVAGPIMRHSDFMHQLRNIQPDRDRMARGCFLILTGLIKKTALADNLTLPVDQIYAHPLEYSGIANLLAACGYSIRIFLDFSGYTDIARGLANLLGLNLPENFRAPFLSRSLRELWQSWHITLSSWIRDYLFIPLGGSRVSPWRAYLNYIVTFALAGLWHGANYTFLAWGIFHGVMVAAERAARNALQTVNPILTGEKWSAFLSFFRGLAVFLVFAAGMIFFNAPDITRAFQMFSRILHMSTGLPGPTDFLLAMIAAGFFFNALQSRLFQWKLPAEKFQYALLVLYGILTVGILGRFAPGGGDFIYFQF